MKNLPKEFVLTNFTKEEGNEVLRHHFVVSRLFEEWEYLTIEENDYGYIDYEDSLPSFPKISYKEWKEIVSSKKRFDYTNSREDIFYKIIYPLFPKEFLFGNDLKEFLKLVKETFILNDIQIEIIIEHWKEKQNILV